MTDQISADTGAIQAAGAKFSSQAVQLADLITQVTQDLNNLEPLWKGQAAGQFVTLMTLWSKDVNDIQQILEQVGQRVNNAGMGYAQLDQDIAKGFMA